LRLLRFPQEQYVEGRGKVVEGFGAGSHASIMEMFSTVGWDKKPFGFV